MKELLEIVSKNKLYGLLIFGIFAVPISGIIPYPGTDVWYVQYLALVAFFFFALSVILWDFNKYVSIFTVVCLVSTVFVASQHPRSMFCLFQVYLSCLAMMGISRLDRGKREFILKAILVLVSIQGVFVVVQYLNIDPFFSYSKNPALDDVVGFSGSHNQIGLFFSDTMPLVVGMCPYLLPLSIFGLWGSTTTVAWLSAGISCLLMLSMTNRKALILTALIFALGSVIFFSEYENFNKEVVKERFDLIKLTVKQVNEGKAFMEKDINGAKMTNVEKCNPWLGFGLGNFMRISPYTQKPFLFYKRAETIDSNGKKIRKGFNKGAIPSHIYSHAHNDLVEVYFELGRVGAVAALLIVIHFILSFIFAKKTKLLIITFFCVLSHLMTSNGIFSVQTAISGGLLIIFYGLYIGELKDGNATKLV